MFAQVKAKYENGVLTPLEPLDLEEGAEVSVTVMVKNVSQPDPLKPEMVAEAEQTEPWIDRYGQPMIVDGLKPSDGLPWIVARVKQRQAMAPPGAYDHIPKDAAMNLKHYLYGHPKEEDKD